MMIYKLCETGKDKKNSKIAKTALCYYPCINSIRVKKLVPNDENDYLKQQINNLKERNEYLLKENNELKKNLPQDKNEITLKNSKIKINKLNLPKSDTYHSSGNPNINSKNYISSREQQHYRNKTVGDENSIFNLLLVILSTLSLSKSSLLSVIILLFILLLYSFCK